MAKLIDATMIQFRMLNASHGPAVQAPRAQADKHAYAALAKLTLEQEKNLTLFQDTVVDFVLDSSGTTVRGVVTERGRRITAPVVVLTTGTFMEGQALHRGVERPRGTPWRAGRRSGSAQACVDWASAWAG